MRLVPEADCVLVLLNVLVPWSMEQLSHETYSIDLDITSPEIIVSKVEREKRLRKERENNSPEVGILHFGRRFSEQSDVSSELLL
jgi:hypothetical protein